jgi:hypothetical protein
MPSSLPRRVSLRSVGYRCVRVLLLCLCLCPAAFAEIAWDKFPAVYDLDEWSIDWSPTHGLVVEAHRIVRVNRSTGIDAGRIRIWDTFFQRLASFEGTVRDTLGHILYTVGLKDVRPETPFSEFRLYSGDVIRAVDLSAPKPPYVFEARWKVEIDNPFFWPDWVLGDSYPRRSASYRIAVPPRYQIRYQQVLPSLVRSAEKQPRREVTRWTLRDWVLPEGAATNHTITPLVYAAPLEFRVGSTKGRTDTWEALGRWYWNLTSKHLGLTKGQVRTVDGQLGDVVGARAQAAALKDWVSDNWRYVAIEVGLGGWQPHPSRDVFNNRYGDCKDVVFLWVSMMRARGLEAYPALTRTRNPLQIDPNFPKDWFDHVIAVTIIDGDTLWADLSDHRYRLGTLPPACEDRWALVVGDFGGRLSWTPGNSSAENRQIVHSQGRVDDKGNLEFTAQVTSGGHFARMLPLRGNFNQAAAAILGIAPPAIQATVDSVTALSADEVTMRIAGRIAGWAVVEPRRMVVHPKLAGWMSADTIAGRPDPGSAEFPMTVYDTLVVDFPEGWTPELWPVATFTPNALGESGEARSFSNGQLMVVRHLRWDGTGRSESELLGSASVRGSYKNAGNAEWIFRLPDSAPQNDSAPGTKGSRDGANSKGPDKAGGGSKGGED